MTPYNGNTATVAVFDDAAGLEEAPILALISSSLRCPPLALSWTISSIVASLSFRIAHDVSVTAFMTCGNLPPSGDCSLIL